MPTLYSSDQNNVFADNLLIYRAIENIVRNALLYTGKNKIIDITLKHTDSHVMIIISDNGPGIPHAELQQILLHFYRVKSAGQSKRSGYGLGLGSVHNATLYRNSIDLFRNSTEEV